MVNEKSLKNIRPPVKGEVRNPKGKPKGVRNFKTVIREFLENVDVSVNGKRGDGYLAIVATLFKLATTKEDVSAIRELIDRLEGKAMQKQELSGPDGGPIETADKTDYSKLSVEQRKKMLAILKGE